jgi:hypothetical protein
MWGEKLGALENVAISLRIIAPVLSHVRRIALELFRTPKIGPQQTAQADSVETESGRRRYAWARPRRAFEEHYRMGRDASFA